MEYPFKDLLPLDEVTARTGYYKDWTHIDADTFHQISELVKFIREKGYGADTREAIAQALERVYHDAAKSGNANMEVSMARKHFKDLASRLNDSDDKLSNTRSEIAVARRGYITLAESLGNLSVNMINKNLGKLDQTYMSDELLAQIAGDAAINAVPADGSLTTEKYAKDSVTAEKTTFFKQSKNLFNKHAVTPNMRVANPGGGLLPIEGVSASELIQVEPNRRYTRSHAPESFAFFEEDGTTFISGGYSTDETKTFVTPKNAHWIRLTVPNNLVNSFQFEVGRETTSYVQYFGELAEDIVIPTITPDMTNFFKYYPVGKNLLDVSLSSKGKQLTSDGSLVDSHNANYDTTHVIEVKPNSTITISRSEGLYYIVRAMLFFDNNKSPLSDTFVDNKGDGSLVYSINVPSNAKYIQISYPNNSSNVQIEQGATASSYEPFVGKPELDSQLLPKMSLDIDLRSINNPWFGKKVVWNGDSITQGYGAQPPFFSDIVASNLGMTSVNYGIGGSTISVKEDNPESRDPIVIRYEEMDDDADLIIIAGGTNDHSYSHTPVGTMEDRTNYTFYGALHNLCLGLINKYVGKQIVFMTPIERYRDRLTTDGYSLADFSDIIQEVCGYYGIPVLDMYREVSLNMDIPAQADAFFADTGGHPNQAGHELMARRITGYLKQLA